MSKKKPTLDYAATFDRIMGEVFEGETFETRLVWSVVNGVYGQHVTTRNGGKKITATQALAGRGVSLALQESVA